MTQKQLRTFLISNGFDVSELSGSVIELTGRTDKGVDVWFTLPELTFDAFKEYVNQFNVNAVSKSFMDNWDYSGEFTATESIADFKAYRHRLNGIIRKLVSHMNKLNKLKDKLSKLNDRLYEAQLREHKRIENMGWGYGMRVSKINFSTSKSDKIKDQIKSVIDEIGELEGLTTF